MGKPRRPASQRPLPDTHRLHHRCLDSRPPAQPALYPRHRAGDILPQVQGDHRHRVAHRAGHRRGNSSPDTLRPCAGLHRGGPVFRAVLCQHPRHGLQHRRACLHCAVHRRHDMVGALALQTEVGQRHPLVVPGRHPPVRHPLHRQLALDTGGSSGRARHMALGSQEAPGKNSHGRLAQRAGDFRGVFELRPAAHPLPRQSPDEPERARQRVLARLIPQPRAVWRDPSALRPHLQVVGHVPASARRLQLRHPAPARQDHLPQGGEDLSRPARQLCGQEGGVQIRDDPQDALPPHVFHRRLASTGVSRMDKRHG